MTITQLLGILLTLGFIAICFSRPLNEKDKAKLKAKQPNWKNTPTIDQILRGNVSRQKNVTTYTFQYTSPEGYVCDTEYKTKFDENGHKVSKHRFNCTMIPTEEPDFD